MEQIMKMRSIIAELRITLDVYIGLFVEKNNVDVFNSNFREIGSVLKKSLATNLIISCAALFTDKDKTRNDENMSFENLCKSHEQYFEKDSTLLECKNKIKQTVDTMKLKDFRNKVVGHFDLNTKLGKNNINAMIDTNNIQHLLETAMQLLEELVIVAKLLPENNYLDSCYNPIPATRSPVIFLDRLNNPNHHNERRSDS